MVVRYARGTAAAPTSGTVPVAQAIAVNCGGKTPKGVEIRLTGSLALGTFQQPARLSVGFSDLTSTFCAAILDENGTAIGSTDTGFRSDNVAIVNLPRTVDETVSIAKARLVSVGADVVNLEWDIVPSAAGALIVEAQVVYGDDAVCKAGTFVSSPTIGAVLPVTGLGFSFGHLHTLSLLNAVFSPDNSGASARLSRGFVAHQYGVIRQVCFNYYSPDRSATAIRFGSSIRDDSFSHRFTLGSTGTITEGPVLSCDSVNPDGFGVKTLAVAGVQSTVAYLAVKTGAQRVWAGIPALVVPPGGGAPAGLRTSLAGLHTIQDLGFKGSDVLALASGLAP
jgi:hypothetical protein